MYLYLGVTSLHYAVESGHTDIVKLLLANGANVNTKREFYGKKEKNMYMHI